MLFLDRSRSTCVLRKERRSARRRRFAHALLLLAAGLGCGVAVACTAAVPTGSFSCAFDRDCPEGQLCGRAGLCDLASVVRTEPVIGVGSNAARTSSGGSDANPATMTAGTGTSGRGVIATLPISGVPQAGVAMVTGGMDGSRAGSSAASAGRAGTQVVSGAGAGGRVSAGTNAAGVGGARPTDGSPCSDAGACESGFCVDGHCCSAARCDGECQRCGDKGQCEPVMDGPDPDSCKGMAVCNAKAHCSLPNGVACKTAAECDSGACVDGVCCERACGMCQACNVAGQLGRCQVQGGDDDTCSSGRSCTLQGECLSVGEASSTFEGGLIYNFGNYRGGQERTGQIVMPRASGTLAEVRLGTFCRSGEVLNASIQSVTAAGQPSGTDLARLTVAETGDVLLQHADHLNAFPLSSALRLNANEPVAIVLTAPGATQKCDARGTTPESYSGGARVWTSTDNMPTSGEYYLEDGDLFFKFLMRP
jgi:hypothetical protein